MVSKAGTREHGCSAVDCRCLLQSSTLPDSVGLRCDFLYYRTHSEGPALGWPSGDLHARGGEGLPTSDLVILSDFLQCAFPSCRRWPPNCLRVPKYQDEYCPRPSCPFPLNSFHLTLGSLAAGALRECRAFWCKSLSKLWLFWDLSILSRKRTSGAGKEPHL